MGTSKRYSEEVRERAVRMVGEHLHEYSSQWQELLDARAELNTASAMRAQLEERLRAPVRPVASRTGRGKAPLCGRRSTRPTLMQ